jgi:hypothetical protein
VTPQRSIPTGMRPNYFGSLFSIQIAKKNLKRGSAKSGANFKMLQAT